MNDYLMRELGRQRVDEWTREAEASRLARVARDADRRRRALSSSRRGMLDLLRAALRPIIARPRSAPADEPGPASQQVAGHRRQRARSSPRTLGVLPPRLQRSERPVDQGVRRLHRAAPFPVRRHQRNASLHSRRSLTLPRARPR